MTSRLRIYALILVSLVFLSGASVSKDAEITPSGRTWVFVAGLVQFQDTATWACFPERNRRDVEVVDAFRHRGVAADHIVALYDRDATLGHLQASLRKLLLRTRPGDTLFVYYEGHGWRSDDGKKFYWVPYDGSEAETCWEISDVNRDIQRLFKGAHYLVATDSCQSGCLADLARSAKNAKVPWAALTSTSRTDASSYYWTFTDAFLDAIRGNPVVDLDHDGIITFSELRRYLGRQMSFCEDQQADAAATRGYGFDTPLFEVTRTLRAGEGRDVVVGERHGQIVKIAGDQSLVRWPGTYDDLREQWVDNTQIDAPQ